MKRLFLTVLLCGVCSPALGQDIGTKLDMESIDYSLLEIANDLSRMRREGVAVYPGRGGNGGMFAGSGGFSDTALDPDGNIVHWSYYAPGMHEKRMKHASRVKRAQEKKAKYAARRVK